MEEGVGGSLQVPAWETIKGRWPAWERPAGPPAATEKGVPPWESAESSRKRKKYVRFTFFEIKWTIIQRKSINLPRRAENRNVQ